jgi:CSLREA domain-containing protein
VEAIRTWVAWTAAALSGLVLCAPAGAATIPVTDFGDDTAVEGTCSLREAITAANTDTNFGGDCVKGDPGADTITIGANRVERSAGGSGEDDNAGGDYDITSNITIVGAGAGLTTIDANQLDRAFDIAVAATVTISGVTITGGAAPSPTTSGADGDGGGGIRNAGTLTLENVRVTDNHAGAGAKGADASSAQDGGRGGDGGGIASSGTLTIIHSTIDTNTSGSGGAGGNGIYGGYGKSGGRGGGIHAEGPTTISSTMVTGNTTGDGGNGGSCSADFCSTGSGTGGAGGGINLMAGATLDDLVVSGNKTGRGAIGAGSTTPGGAGGGVSFLGTTLTLTDTTITGNATPGGRGGGIYVDGTSAEIGRSTITANATGQSSAIPSYAGSGGGGGGIATSQAPLLVTNTTIAANTTYPGGDGAGVWVFSGSPTFRHVTIAGNDADPGGNGGGIAVLQQDLTLANSIVASNAPNNCTLFGASHYTDGGHNVRFGDTSCPGTTGDPQLGALANNGGPTQTMALGSGSAARDVVPVAAADCATTDQRGTPRPLGPACDAGAFEAAVVQPSGDAGGGADNQTQGGGTSTATTTPPPPPVAQLDDTAPTVRLILTRQKLRKALRHGYVCGFATTEPGSAAADLRLKSKRVAHGTLAITNAGRARLLLKFTKHARKALAAKRKLVLTLVLAVKDAAGNTTRKTARVVLRR